MIRRDVGQRGGASAATLGLAAIVFLVFEVRLIRSRGPIRWAAPSTVVSNSHPAQQHAVPLILFLRAIRPVLPPGARVAVVGPDAGNESAPLDDLIAIGQLPQNDVVPVRGYFDRTIPPPRFLAVQLGGSPDDRYRLVAVLESGRLYEWKP